jgi:hypothetical protein
MYNFQWNVPTNLYFGKGQICHLGDEVKKLGRNVLLVYGFKSIKVNGIYDEILKQLKDCSIVELSGIEPNPKIDSVRKGVELCRSNNVDVIVACGGGSVIDASKVIAAGFFYDGDPWDLMLDQKKVNHVLPIISIVTMAASGSEMDRGAVISNMETKQKLAIGSVDFYPRVSICDPQYMFSLPQKQTGAGVVDIFSHAFEIYFNETMGAYLSDYFAEAIMKVCVKCASKVIENPTDYEIRANIMWASTQAMNGVLRWGRGRVILPCHGMEHELGAYYDITHGEGLGIIIPEWMKYVLNIDNVSKFAQYGRNVFELIGEDDEVIAKEAICKTEQFIYDDCKIQNKLADLGISNSVLEEMSSAAVVNGELLNAYPPLDKNDVKTILMNCIGERK